MSQDENGLIKIYVYGLGLISQEDLLISDEKKTYKNFRNFHYDHRGNTIALTDVNGEITDIYDYGPYNELVDRRGKTENIFLASGLYGVETDFNGLVHMRARFYNQDLRRFVNIDPLRDGTNWYVYANGNPINNVDPTGTFAISAALISIGAAAITGAVSGAVIGGAIGGVLQGQKGKGILISALKGAGRGAVTGAVGAAAGAAVAAVGIGSTIVAAGASGAASNITGGFLDGERKISDVAFNTLTGAITGVVSHKVTEGVKKVASSAISKVANSKVGQFLGNNINKAASKISDSKIGQFGKYIDTKVNNWLDKEIDVSRWGGEGLNKGNWVMKGKDTMFNYIRSFKWDFISPTNIVAPRSSGKNSSVPRNTIKWPTGWGMDGWWKGLFGQRIYMP